MNTNAFAGGVFSPTSSSISLPEEITVPGNYANGSTLWKSTATVFNLKAVLNTAIEYDVSKADRKSTRLNSSHSQISYAVFCLKKKKPKNLVHLILSLQH